VPRSGEEARRRLRDAALELYRELGFDHVTTAEIAARAGVTERTFFRHFPDKREVLFAGEAEFRAALVDAVVAAPAELSPLEALLASYRSVAGIVERNRPFTEPRQEVIAATPALRERALNKAAATTDDLAAALRRRGVPDSAAALAAQVGAAVAAHATRTWFEDPSADLQTRFREAFEALRSL
jgi:AcrR family transcriptional regulator